MARQATDAAKDVPGQQELMAFVDDIEPHLEIADAACRTDRWESYLQEDTQPPSDCEAKRAALLLDERTWLTVMRWAGELSDEDPLQRRLVLLGRKLIPASVECRTDVYELQHKVETRFLSSPPRLRKERRSWGDFRATLHTHPDRRHRERAWNAQVPVANKLRNNLLELVRRRNYWAQREGYETYTDLILAPQGLSRDSVLERYVDLEEVTLDDYQSVLSQIRMWQPFDHPAAWDITYFPEAWLSSFNEQATVFRGSSPDIVALIKALGIAWDSFHFAPQLTDRLPYPCLCWPVHTPDDVRLSMSRQQGWDSYIEIARAFGRAILPGCTHLCSYLLTEQAACYQAGMGAFLGRVAADPVWLRKRGLLPGREQLQAAKRSRDQLALRLRWLMALSVFEFQMYETPEADLDVIWGEIQEAFLFLPNIPWPGWAAQADYIFRPIHLQNEIIGELIASQAMSYLQQRFGSLFDNPEVPEFLRESFYGNGSVHEWTDQVRVATGKFLSDKALFGELRGEE
jgi:hypothetical protein